MCVRLETKHRRPAIVAVLACQEKGLPHSHPGPLAYPIRQPEPQRSQHYDSGAVLEPPHFFAALQRSITGHHIGPAIAQMQQHIEEAQSDTRHQDGRHRHQRQDLLGSEPAPDAGAFVLAEQPVDAFQRNGIDVPGVTGNIVDLFHPAISRRVKSVVHARGQPQRCVLPAFVVLRQLRVRQQLAERVEKAFRLQERALLDGAAPADQAIAGTDQMRGVHIDGAGAGLQLPREAVVQALEARGFRLAQIQVGKQAPQRDAAVADPWMFDAAPPAHEAGHKTARNAVAEQEIDVFLLGQPLNQGSGIHRSVIRLQYSPRLAGCARYRLLRPSAMFWALWSWHFCCEKSTSGCSFPWQSTARSRAIRVWRAASPPGYRFTSMTIRASLASTRRRHRLSRRGAPALRGSRLCLRTASGAPSSRPSSLRAACRILNSLPATACRFNSAAMYASV